MKGFLIKLVAVGIVGLILLAAGSMVRGVVSDRMEYREQARASITESLASGQRIAGVVLRIAYSEHFLEPITDDKKQVLRMEPRRIDHELDVLPETLAISGSLITEARRRGIFKVNGYVLNGALKGQLALPALSAFPHDRSGSTLELGQARLVLAISDPRGLRKLEMRLDEVAQKVEPGTGLAGLRAGAHAPVSEIGSRLGKPLNFNVDLELVGTDSLQIVPLGRETTASLSSPWQHPSFGGRFLPVERRVSPGGFEANWRVSALATDAREVWQAASKNDRGAALDTFSVALIDPVDVYVMSDRAGKYAELFVALTLGAFLLFELLRRLGLHPMHYLLIGAAMLVFFLLLLALSEHLGFGLAYLAAASGCVLLIGFYSAHLLRSLWLASGFTAGLAAMYGALYGILLSEQNALLMGSLLVFVLLAGVMIATRKVDWHSLDRRAPAATTDEEA